ncbi:hypothetical protein B0T25DRAFT_598118 [Lasiosphaeria hispida]|uniref:Uncharacterized protein n=1 Tax=Lasiosphaeria hispida TaxID=260671 RepID=A0AAJ0MKY6_9PEZI|nr:hypothetical protein B0T25DRAFT_598118 [Lasiosphaeria hispida]
MAMATSTREREDISTFSIPQLLALYPRERLFVHPLLWTTRHLRLVHCQFLNLGEVTITVPPAPSPPRARSTAIHDDADEVQRHLDEKQGEYSMQRRLATDPHPITRGSALSRLLRERTYCGDRIPLSFAHRAVANLLCKTYSHRAQPSYPSLAYVDLSDITLKRRIRLGDPSAVSYRRPNPPKYRRAQKLVRRHTPTDPFEDPYIFALFVALAQQRRLRNKNSNEDTGISDAITPSPPSPPLPMILLVTRPSDTTWLHIYTSNISTEMSDRFDYPSRTPPTAMPPATIYRRQLAFEPYETLQQRLAAVVDGKWQEGKWQEGCAGQI